MNPEKKVRWQLASVKVRDRLNLPKEPGCYYVFRGRNIIYIGKTTRSLKARWSGHHKLHKLRGGDRIHYWIMKSSQVGKQEAKDIRLFDPRLNDRYESIGKGAKPRSSKRRKPEKTPLWVNLGCLMAGVLIYLLFFKR